MLRRSRAFRFAALAALLGCEGVPLAPPTLPTTGATATVLLRAPTTLLDLGESVQIAALSVDTLGDTSVVQGLVWSSRDPAVATVSGTGLVRAGLEGRTTIAARAPNGTTGTLVLDVVPASARSLVVTPRDSVMLIPDAAVLTATVRARDGRDLGFRNVWWTVADSALVRVVRITENTVRVYPQGKGVVQFTARTEDGVVGQTRLRMEPDTIHQVKFEGSVSAALATNGKANSLTVYALGLSSRGRLVPATTVSYWMSRHDVVSEPYLFDRKDGATGLGFILNAPGTVKLVVTLDGIQEIVTLEVRPAESCSAAYTWLCP